MKINIPQQALIFSILLIVIVIVVGIFSFFNILIGIPDTTADVNGTGVLPNSAFYIPIFVFLLLT